MFVCRSACLISAGGPLKTNLRGHTQRINNVAITKDDKFIVSSGKNFSKSMLLLHYYYYWTIVIITIIIIIIFIIIIIIMLFFLFVSD